MDRLRRALIDSKKNKETMISKEIEKSLQHWKLPLSSASDVFKPVRSYWSDDNTTKTVEKEIQISEDYSTFPLFTDYLQRVHLKNIQELDLHMGMIQVGLKATKLGSNTSAIICLRDKRVLEFHQSILGMVESSLCDAPIYFYYFPDDDQKVSLADQNFSSAYTIDIKINGSSQNVILMYRFHYKLLHKDDDASRKLPSGLVRDVKGETTLFLPSLARSNRVVSKKVYWDQVSVPEGWMVRTDPSSSAVDGRVDWKETAEAHVLRVDVPGFERHEVEIIDIEDGGILQISGERSKEEEEVEEENYEWHCQERGTGKFLRRFRMPENANLDLMGTAMAKGVLTVTFPKKEVNKKQEMMALQIYE